MALEIRIMTGARAGQVAHFDKAVVVAGRQKDVDLRFDAQKDVDVSGRHAELRMVNGGYVVADLGSTNGTYVNGEKIAGPRELRNGDRVQFGASGPDVEVRIRPGIRNTEERIAIAVKKQTAGLRRMAAVGVVLLAAGVGGAFWVSQRSSQQRVEELSRLLHRNDSLSAFLQGGIRTADPSLVEELRKKTQALREAMASATTDSERDSLRREIEGNDFRLRRMVQMDLSSIHRRNAPAVAMLISEIRGTSFSGTAFGITPDGLMLTNRHNLLSEQGDTAGRLVVKFVDTREWLPARIVKMSDDPDEDLALLQVVGASSIPVVQGISPGAEATEGTSVVTIGFPLGYSTPQEGEEDEFIAKSTLNPGTVSKRTSGVLQIDSYAAVGSSGSPVFDSMGHVVGVVFGGQRGAGGRIVFAVPPDRVAGFARATAPAAVRD